VHLGEYLAYLFRYIGLHQKELNAPGIQPEEKMQFLKRLCLGILKRSKLEILDLILYMLAFFLLSYFICYNSK